MDTDESSEFIAPELKHVHMTVEYAAQYYHKMGWMACRLAHKIYQDAEEAGAFRV